MADAQFSLDLLLPDLPDAQDACVSRLRGLVAAQDGVSLAHATTDGRSICIHFDPGRITLSEVERLVKAAGADLEVLDAGRVILGKVSLVRAPLDLGMAVRTTLESLRSTGRLESHHVEVAIERVDLSGSAEVDHDCWPAVERVDRDGIGQAIRSCFMRLIGGDLDSERQVAGDQQRRDVETLLDEFSQAASDGRNHAAHCDLAIVAGELLEMDVEERMPFVGGAVAVR